MAEARGRCQQSYLTTQPTQNTLASLAQSVEHQTFNLRAAGSSPAGGLLETHTATFSSILIMKTKCVSQHQTTTVLWRSGLTRPTQARIPSGAQVRTLLELF